MKKGILSITAIALFSGALLFSGCGKDDVTAPSITLTGSNSITVGLGDTYTDLGATANDDTDGDITTSITKTGDVNTTQVGTYTITYSVSDAAGNAATEVTRTVKVTSDKLAGGYDVSDVTTGTNPGTYTYTVAVSQSSTDYNKIYISNFGGFGASVSVYATVNGSVITIPSQSPSGMVVSGTISGSGQYTNSGSIFKITNVTYSAAYTGGGADNGNAAYTKL